jgi:hypothetical protein
MRTVYETITLGRCLLGGLFTGIIGAVVAVVFNVVYRGAVDLTAYAIVVMPVSIFMLFPLFNLIAGGVYFLFIQHLKKGAPLFIMVFALVMLLGAAVTWFTGSTSDRTEDEFKGLVVGLELIEGILGAILIPFFVNHPGLYLTDKDIRGEE